MKKNMHSVFIVVPVESIITNLFMFLLLSCRYSERTMSRPSEVLSHGGGTSSSPSEEMSRGRKPSANRGKRRRRNPDFDDSQYETEYTTGGETGNELDGEERERWELSLCDWTVLSLCSSYTVWIKDETNKGRRLQLNTVAPTGPGLNFLIWMNNRNL